MPPRMLSTVVGGQLPAAHPSDPLPCPSSPSSSEASDDDALTPCAHDAQLPAHTASADQIAEPLEAFVALEVQVGRLKAVISHPVVANEQDAVPAQRVRLLETELRDKDSVLQQEQREVEKLKQEIMNMDAERHMFEKQLSAAEDAAKTATTRLRKVQDAANRLENDVASLKEKTTADVATLRQKLDQALSSVQRALDQQDGTPTGAVAGGGAAPSTEQTDRLEGTSCDEVDMWTGRYLNGRSAFCPRSRLPSPPRCCRTA